MDSPGGRRKHRGKVARLGSLPLWGAFTAAALLAQRMPIERGDHYEVIRLAGRVGGGRDFVFFPHFCFWHRFSPFSPQHSHGPPTGRKEQKKAPPPPPQC